MAVITTVQFGHPNGALVHTLGELPEASVRVLRDAGTDPHHDATVFMFDGEPLDRIESVLEDDPSVASIHPMPNYQGTHVIGIEFSGETELLMPTVTAQQGFSLEAKRTDPECGTIGWWERWLFSQRSGLNAVWEHARDAGFTFEVLAINEFHSDGSATTGSLTADQRDTILVAYEHGYFAEPRETSLEELADVLDLSSTAVGGRIRRGVNALVEATIVEEADSH